MRRLTVAIFTAIIVCAVWTAVRGAQEVQNMTEKLVRIHVIANSDSDSDQQLKFKVRDGILNTVTKTVGGAKDKAEAMERISENLGKINFEAEKIVAESGKDYPVTVTLKPEEFSERVYDGFTLPAGVYDSLCVRIGEAAGRNWWCVCYPGLCLGSAVSVDDCGVFTEGELKIIKEPAKVRYKLWCFELIRKIKKFF